MTLVSVDDVEAHYGDLQILREVTMRVEEDESVVAIIGPNGAGKTTLLKAMSGLVSLTSGRIEILGQDISELQAHEIIKTGFVHVPQERNLFDDMSVLDNLRMGAFTTRDDFEARVEEIFEMFPILEERQDQLAGTLSGGQQQMVAIGRGLMAQPEVMALDEPSAGLAPQLSDRVFEKIEEISDDVTVILVEQHVEQTLNIADKAYLLQNGEVTGQGTGQEMLESEAVHGGFLS